MDEKELNGTPADESADLALDGSLELDDESETDDGEVEIPEDAEADTDADTDADAGEKTEAESEDDFDLERALEEAFAEDGGEDDTDGDEKPGEKSTTPEDAGEKKSDAETAPDAEPATGDQKKEDTPEESEDVKKLRADYEKLKRRSRDALKSLGIESEDTVEGLERLAREQSDMTDEEYRADLARRDAEEDDAARKRQDDAMKRLAAVRSGIEKKKASDLAAIHEVYPTSKKYTKLDDIPNFERYKQLRDGGASADEAFSAVNAADIAADLGEIAHRRSLEASKSHLKSVAGKSAGGTVKIPASEYRMIKGLLGDDVSDAEIAKYYKKVTKG